MRLFVGNLPWSVGDDELRDLFAEIGEVSDSKVITERGTGRSRGFGFIEMGDEEGKKAIESMHGMDIEGRDLQVNEAEERKPRERRF
jgi:RNA recognition motif-containing protein